MQRRAFLQSGLALASFAAARQSRTAFAAGTDESFDQLFAQVTANDALLASGRSQREGWAQSFETHFTMALAPRPPISSLTISNRAADMIRSFEVSSPRIYDKLYQGATWPEGQSGITIGIGYDVGYVTAEWLHEDWDGKASERHVRLLEQACEKTGHDAKNILNQFTELKIDYHQANEQFVSTTLPRTVGETVLALPHCDELKPDSLGALTSLVYNRGASFKAQGARYAEMRSIRVHMVKREFSKIPDELRGMKRLWQDDDSMRGLLIRRELEAKLFEEGLNG